MNLLSLCQADTELKRVATTRGGEYAGACPWCGGRDRFRVWPEQGRYWCRGCGRHGDTVQYLRDKRGMSFKEAWTAAGRGELPDTSTKGRGPTTAAVRPETTAWTPSDISLPGEQWQEQAGKLVSWAAGKLGADARAYLNKRGLADETIQAAKLGLIPADRYARRGPWGLPKEYRDNGKEKDLWIPAGVVIPYFVDGKVARVRIRRFEGEPRYYVVSGSFMGPMVLGQNKGIFLVVESELDALLLWQEGGDMAGVIALGSAGNKPDTRAAAVLSEAELILVALDDDKAGADASWQWWLKQYPEARRWPSVGGKDIGEMWQAGVDLGEWVEAGISEYLPY